ncbi:serine protease [Actinorhabdospora filicis]|uniref:Serine protease n=1 Tax=Actinorhabdospora filicis TaxID=1785913 RepID=A0A9W6W7N1_9ACTN|nr:S8 family serine peptidase [Actinorhabdospora filicis]GLZ76729.1 serine protease [Actinorhabdospora filicis]
MALAGAAAVTLLLGSAHAAQADPAATPVPVAAPGDGRTHTLTLITGDRVRIEADGTAVFLPGKGREGVGHLNRTRNGDRYVIPGDAVRAFTDGRLDERLFNVSGLLRDGYADTGALPLIVSGGSAARSLAADGTRLDSIDATASTMDGEAMTALWASMSGTGLKAAGASKVWLDGRMRPALDVSVPQVGAPAAWAAGYDGTGTTIAIIDSGLDTSHPDVAGRVKAIRDFTGTAPDGADDIGHGTHVASIAAGSGAASNGRYKGVAPKADLLIAKVCVNGSCQFSDIIAGMEWSVAQGADVANMSLGGPAGGTDDPVVAALERLTAESGTLFAVAAGNSYEPRTIESPGSAPSALTVASVTKTDERSDFSSQGPNYDWSMKPDITAPGSDITAARAAGTEGEGDYATHSGTSMATPHVTGAAALLKQQHPDWTAARLKSTLVSSAKGLDGLSAFQEGAGRLDLTRAIGQHVTADGGVGFGMFAYPQDQPAATKTVTYTNDGDTDVTLDVSLTRAAPGFSVDSPQVTVPAHGSATVAVSYDPDPARGYGDFAAELVASDATTSVRTAVGASTEPELYTLSLPVTKPDGETTDFYSIDYINLDNGERGWLPGAGEPIEPRVSPGHYRVMLTFFTVLGEEHYSTLGVGEIEVRADTSLPFDLRAAKPVTLDLEGEGERLSSGDLWFTIGEPGEEMYTNAWPQGMRLLPGGSTAPARLEMFAVYRTDTESIYVTHRTDGPLPAGLDVFFRRADLARVDHQVESRGVTGTKALFMFGPSGAGTWTGTSHPAPGTVTVYYSPGLWSGILSWGDGDEDESGRFTAALGQTAKPRWNRSPLSFGFDARYTPIGRYNHFITANLGMFASPDPERQSSYGSPNSHISLDANGERVLDADLGFTNRFVIPDGLSGDFTLRLDAERDVPWSAIGTRASAEYRWKQGYQPDTSLPVLMRAVRLNATGVKDGFASARLPQLVSLSVLTPTGQAATKSLTFDVSYDDGKTWTTVPVARYGETAVAVLFHPAGATGVSTRMTMVDADGNSSVQTTIRSYGLK